MEVIKQKDIDIDDLIMELRMGKVIVYPTETCYGLGCDATNQEAVNRLFDIKQRQKEKSVLVLIDSTDMAGKYINWTPKIEDLARKYWPGPLTIVGNIKNRGDLADGVVGSDGTLAFRITDHHFAQQICKQLGRPLVSTSANISHQQSPYDIESVLQMYKDAEQKPDIIIDAGVLPHRNPSTIVKVENEKVEIIRQGGLVLS